MGGPGHSREPAACGRLLYMDEIFGYFPPVAEPPSKKPLLTLLKQARAYGLGVLLATQNPVDLDYKGLANTGTWFIGRLQTERDKARVLEGLEGVAAGSATPFDKQAMEQVLAGLGSRVFLMYNVHEDAPVVFQSRWAMSYLRGPLTRTQIKTLMDAKRGAAPVAAADVGAATSQEPAGAAPIPAPGARRRQLPPSLRLRLPRPQRLHQGRPQGLRVVGDRFCPPMCPSTSCRFGGPVGAWSTSPPPSARAWCISPTRR